ncbi:hypothetical protein LR48_Vigan04g037900 [Vigna angularis]|uniref:Exocyst subunit Exo70 family protein n=1 Tax=Phaseolus angularis TaxID=3914 RepID=A0A0L9UBU7_PHAAN|nr:hypothetical protein LR48_Vigan04g037900 [Vigna angularis]
MVKHEDENPSSLNVRSSPISSMTKAESDQHFEVVIKKVLFSENKLCEKVLGDFMEGLVWPECFIKISDKILVVFFRFGEGGARSRKEPQKLFKLLEVFESLEKLKPHISQIFEGEPGADICTRFRELEKLIIDASSKVLWEFELQIEGNIDGLPPPQDGSVPKLKNLIFKKPLF